MMIYSTWQPIETAPKDGSVILVYDNVGGSPNFSGVFTSADWPQVHVLPARWVVKFHDRGEWETVIAEYDFGVASDPSFDATSISLDPTHWMPLPVAPSNADEELNRG